MGDRTFVLPEGEGSVSFEKLALEHMYSFAQRRFYQPETGGQLFSPTPHHQVVTITDASGPNPHDVRSRHTFIPNAHHATTDRQFHFTAGRHPIGLWHTHPEANPTPSMRDHETACEFLDSFGGSMSGFLLVIIGNKGSPLNMAVWLARAKSTGVWIPLTEQVAINTAGAGSEAVEC